MITQDTYIRPRELHKNKEVCIEILRRNLRKSLFEVIRDLFSFSSNNIAAQFQKDSSLGKYKYQSTENGILMNKKILITNEKKI